MLMILPFFIQAQEATTPGPPQQVPVEGKIEDDEGAVNGAQIIVVQGGKTILNISTGADGKYAFQLPLGNDYVVSVTRAGYITKKFAVSTRGVPPEIAQYKFKGFQASPSIWPKVDGVDYSALNQPASKFFYDPNKQDFTNDKAYQEQMAGLVANIREQEETIKKGKKDADKNYQAAISAGDKSFGKKDYQAALSSYNQALSLKKDDTVAKQKIDQTNQAIKADADAKAAADAKAKADADAKAKADADAKAKAAADAKAKADADAKAKADADAKAAADAKAKADADAKAKAAADAKAKADADAKAKADADAKSKADADAKSKSDADAKSKADADAKSKSDADAKAAADAKAKADADADADAKSKSDADAKAAADAKAKADADAKSKADADAAKKKADDDAKNAADAKSKSDADAKAAADAKSKAAADAKSKAAADAKAKADALAKSKADDDKERGKAKNTIRQQLGGSEVQYKAAKDRGDNSLKFKQYQDAVNAYTEALTYKPNDAYATTKLAFAQKNLGVVASVDKNNTLVAKKNVNHLSIEYPQGVTEKTTQEKGGVIIKRIVVKGDDAWVYIKKIFSFGTVVYYKDDETVTQSVWDNETKP